MTKPVILTGLRANNDLHIGNYFGALLPLIDMAKNHANDYEVNLFVPDLHSFTTPIDHSQLHDQIMHNLKLYVAAGLPLDNPSVHIYRQSYVPAHSELTWILDCFTGFGQMARMTQFKDKTIRLNKEKFQEIEEEIGRDNISRVLDAITDDPRIQNSVSVGLFNYPVLMAADILLYGANYVPVGDDQSQHLEFARDIAQRMNSKFKEQLFIIPKAVSEQHAFFGKDQGLRIKDLVDPTKKMSKSDDTGKGVIFLGDSPDEASKKIMSATTDSLGKIDFDNQEQAGLRNILQIYELTTGHPQRETYNSWEQYGPFKADAARAVATFLASFQSRLAKVDETQLLARLESDEKQMNEIANITLLKVQRAVGLRA